MVTLKAIQSRLKAVTNTSKITKAMKMVAASKLRRAQTAMEEALPFSAANLELLEPYIGPKEGDEVKSRVLLAISSDKGLCGGINSKVVKEIKTTLDAPDAPAIELMLVGGKARDGLARTHSKKIKISYDETYGGPVTFSLAAFLAEQMLANSADTYTILYNKFRSVISQEVTELTFKGPEILGESGVMDEYEFEGDKEHILPNLYQYNLACSLYGCLLQNVTSEQASRMSAMDSASTNAKDMIGRLTIIYNRGRQAKITTELTEIVAGAESV
jgi:F-type H+-transporting ATPase subunit gamma